MHKTNKIRLHKVISVCSLLALIFLGNSTVQAQSLDIPSKKWGISFGNSKNFTGLRFNIQDDGVQKINGINFTLWKPKKDNPDSVINGLSLGLMPGGGHLQGIQLGIVGVGAEASMKGINIGLLGAGAGENMYGVNIGGLGVGAGEKLAGINIGGLGCGSTEVTGISFGGLGVGGKYLKGIHLSLGSIMTDKSGGVMTGLAVSSFNNIRGEQVGLSIGIVNYAWNVKGLQIGLVNIVRNNPRGLKVLPLFNTSF